MANLDMSGVFLLIINLITVTNASTGDIQVTTPCHCLAITLLINLNCTIHQCLVKVGRFLGKVDNRKLAMRLQIDWKDV